MNRVQIRSIFDRKKKRLLRKKDFYRLKLGMRKNASSSLPELSYTKTNIEVDV